MVRLYLPPMESVGVPPRGTFKRSRYILLIYFSLSSRRAGEPAGLAREIYHIDLIQQLPNFTTSIGCAISRFQNPEIRDQSLTKILYARNIFSFLYRQMSRRSLCIESREWGCY